MKVDRFSIPLLSFWRKLPIIIVCVGCLQFSSLLAQTFTGEIEDIYYYDEEISSVSGPEPSDDPATAYRARRMVTVTDLTPHFELPLQTWAWIQVHIYKEISYNWGSDWEPHPVDYAPFHLEFWNYNYASIDEYTGEVSYYLDGDSGTSNNGMTFELESDEGFEKVNYTLTLGEQPGTTLGEEEHEFSTTVWVYEY